ncbi:endolytic transglycosylase MltG [Amycolatopsis pigmentata]|uniref:Endolytic murein transglycosylase n=1 Tax=Amycolatopsis pigmentata TaxID=450801 RepID=A0ABW5G8D5_9PSEU
MNAEPPRRDRPRSGKHARREPLPGGTQPPGGRAVPPQSRQPRQAPQERPAYPPDRTVPPRRRAVEPRDRSIPAREPVEPPAGRRRRADVPDTPPARRPARRAAPPADVEPEWLEDAPPRRAPARRASSGEGQEPSRRRAPARRAPTGEEPRRRVPARRAPAEDAPPRRGRPPRRPEDAPADGYATNPPRRGRRAEEDRADGYSTNPPRKGRRAAPAEEGLELFDEEPPRRAPAREDPTEIIHLVDEDFDDEGYPGDYMPDERAEPEYIEPADEAPKRPRRRFLRWVAALAVIGLFGGGAWFGVEKVFGYADFPGNGESDVVIQIGDGDSTGAIGGELTTAGVVASAKAFVKASKNNDKVLSLQPGYYVLKTKMSGSAAVAMLTSGTARVGELQVRAGTQLDDITQPGGSVTPGLYSLLSKASCATLNGKSTCVSPEDLRKAAQSADLATLGVADWAASAAAKSTDPHRLEGLIAPGVYDVRPGSDAGQLLGTVLKASTTKIQAAGLTSGSTVQQQAPYQVLTIASLIEREGVSQDFEKISRVIYNRLDKNMRLQFDSTVNYVLDKPVVTTTDADRNKQGPYNTYQNAGLTPTPIGSPSTEAIEAALHPADGAWLFFVKCDKNGVSCFATTQQEHSRNIEVARQNGAF